jgi:hypothetical protein
LGGLPQAFDCYAQDWQKEQAQLAEIRFASEFLASTSRRSKQYVKPSSSTRAILDSVLIFPGMTRLTVLFPDLGGTNSAARFYRATLQ